MSKRKVKFIKFPLRDKKLPEQAYSPEGYKYALVRIALPENTRLKVEGKPLRYYRPDATDGIPWVTTGYKTWRIDEWRDTYGEQYLNDIRHWDFFGEEISIWDDNTQEN